jgi:hypothetical protein
VAAAGLPLDGLADAAWRGRGIGAARTTAALERIDVTGAPAALPAALQAAAELRDACPASAWALLRLVARLPRWRSRSRPGVGRLTAPTPVLAVAQAVRSVSSVP